MNSRAGYVLVGGLSSRMGRDKTLLKYGNSTLLEHVADIVREAAGVVSLVGGTYKYQHLTCDFVPDLYPGEGPLGGILSALQNSSAEWNLIVACDMPSLTADFLRHLIDAAEHSGGDALVPTGPAGMLEPLCAVYHHRSLEGLRQAFSEGTRKIATALEKVRTVTLAVREVHYFQNVNTPEEWQSHGR